MRRLLSRLLGPWLNRLRCRSRAPEKNGLTAVEYEAVTLIAYEGRKAYARAREQALGISRMSVHRVLSQV